MNGKILEMAVYTRNLVHHNMKTDIGCLQIMIQLVIWLNTGRPSRLWRLDEVE